MLQACCKASLMYATSVNIVFIDRIIAQFSIDYIVFSITSILTMSFKYLCSCRDYKVVHMFSRSPWQRELPSWYPPIPTYNSLLLRLRTLGLYHHDHLDFKEKMAQQRKARGKGPPAKGWYDKHAVLLFDSVLAFEYVFIIVFVKFITGQGKRAKKKK